MPRSDRGNIVVIIAGAGKAGELLSEDILQNSGASIQIVGFVDDDDSKQGTQINSIEVIGKLSDLRKLVKLHKVDEIFICLPSERGAVVRGIVQSTMGLKLSYKILPRLSEVLLQDYSKDYIKYIRKVEAEDLLGGEILKEDQHYITEYTKGQTILITGAAGSIGSELSRQLAAHKPKLIIFYDWWENGMFDLRAQILENHVQGEFIFVIGDVKDRKKLNMLIKMYKPQTIFHAAAYKHVPLMEHNPTEAIKNNILGTKTVAELAIKHKVKKFVLVSTDKAVNPTNIMGATKRAAEKVIHILAESQDYTTFCAVRFGNVINSNGSAIPTFERQIQQGGPVTVTDKEVTRFFMTIPEAVHLILQSWVMGKNNDLFVLDMGEAIKIYELVKLLIALEGYIPDEEIQIKIIGLRPGEKLYEEVLMDEEQTNATAVKKVFKTQNHLNFNTLAFLNNLNMLLESVEEYSLSADDIKRRMQKMVSTYKPTIG